MNVYRHCTINIKIRDYYYYYFVACVGGGNLLNKLLKILKLRKGGHWTISYVRQ